MKNILLFLLLCYSMFGFSQGVGIQFKTLASMDEAISNAKREKKLVFIDCHAEWCGWCKKMKKEIFSLSNIGDYFNSNFICYSVDVDKSDLSIKEIIRQKYQVGGLPTLLFIDSIGNLVHKIVGYRNDSMLIVEAKIAQDTLHNMQYYKKRIEVRNDSAQILMAYLKINYDSKERFKLIDSCINSQSIDKRFSPDIWELITLQYNYTIHYSKFIFENESNFKKNIGILKFDNQIESDYALSIYRNWHIILYFKKRKAIHELKLTNHPLVGRIIRCADLESAIIKFNRKKNKSSFVNVIKNSKKYFASDSYNSKYLSKVSQLIYNNFKTYKSPESLSYAMELVKKDCNIQKSYDKLLLYAQIVFEMGDKNDAILKMTEVLEIAKQEKNNTKIDYSIKKIEEYKK